MNLSPKEKILNFLKQNEGRKFTVLELSRQIEISYPTVLKYIDVLIAEGSIKVIDFRNAKVVWYEG